MRSREARVTFALRSLSWPEPGPDPSPQPNGPQAARRQALGERLCLTADFILCRSDNTGETVSVGHFGRNNPEVCKSKMWIFISFFYLFAVLS